MRNCAHFSHLWVLIYKTIIRYNYSLSLFIFILIYDLEIQYKYCCDAIGFTVSSSVFNSGIRVTLTTLRRLSFHSIRLKFGEKIVNCDHWDKKVATIRLECLKFCHLILTIISTTLASGRRLRAIRGLVDQNSQGWPQPCPEPKWSVVVRSLMIWHACYVTWYIIYCEYAH